ncbi:hypothetical protein [Paraburkholderia saeva]|uniref:Uncharacterized protein n=1 Tax=Paraburkholderia saeva TaxID=2777537 RepID=A0A9N8RYK4_9BURK|nr:hypothetical protein [Paraburkholderia saeva]CAG4906354.1 hypothetical protein LMG31841_03550 [Paraburkholderia saeva]
MSYVTDNPTRYVSVVVNGHTQRFRDQAILQVEGAMPKKRIIMALRSAQAAIEAALTALLEGAHIEHYRAMSVRRRLDEHWCIAGQAPAMARTNFRAMEILAGFQQAAARHIGGVSA